MKKIIPKNKKRIQIVAKYFAPVAAGIETNMLETYSVLVKHGWDVTAHVSKDTLSEKDVLPKEETIRGIKIKRYDFKWWGFCPQIDFNETDAICLHNFNIVPHIYIILYSLYLKMVGRKNYALMLTPHGGFNPEWSVFPIITRILKPIYHYTFGMLLINLVVDGVRGVSNWEGKELKGKGVLKSKVAVISNGVEDEAYLNVEKLASLEVKKIVASWGKYLIQIGRVYPIKNYETTIRALPLIPKDINFVIVGPFDHVMGKAAYQDELMSLAKKLGVEKRVIFGGVIKGVDKYYLIKKAEMMVHMAKWESFCNVVHEGLSQGLVCIVANNTALPLLIKDGVNGYCVETYDYKTVAEKVNFVLENEKGKFIQEMKKRNRIFGLEHSWSQTALAMGEWYEKTIHKIRGIH